MKKYEQKLMEYLRYRAYIYLALYNRNWFIDQLLTLFMLCNIM